MKLFSLTGKSMVMVSLLSLTMAGGLKASSKPETKLSEDKKTAIVVDDKEYKDAIAVASKMIMSDNWQVRDVALKMFDALFDWGKGYQEGTIVAINGVQNEDSGIKADALFLFEELVKHGQALKEAEAAAIKAMQDTSDEEIPYVAKAVLKALAEKQPQPTLQPAQQPQAEPVV